MAEPAPRWEPLDEPVRHVFGNGTVNLGAQAGDLPGHRVPGLQGRRHGWRRFLPGGPVDTMSPGRNCAIEEMYSINAPTPKTMSEVDSFCITLSFTDSSIVRLIWIAGVDSRTNHGPVAGRSGVLAGEPIRPRPVVSSRLTHRET